MDFGKRRFLLGFATALFFLAVYPAAAQGNRPVIFAAASLKTVLDDIAAQWQQETKKPVAISYAASSALARQIEQGAPADLFISADLDWMDYLQQRNLIRVDTRSSLLGNRIVLVAPKDSTATATIAPGFNLAGLLGTGRLAMADVNAVPAGKYGKAALESLGVWTTVQDKVAQSENVRAALLLVARGEAPLGIVYRTDAAAEPGVKIVGAFPENTHPAIVYPVAQTSGGRNPDAAAFLAYLKSARARAHFEKQGFTVLEPIRTGGTS
jgi:molybdate transport system substrate-binding protein